MKKIIDFCKNNILLIVLIAVSLLILAVNIRINFFRYNNFDYGKFDLGNMTQMVWNVTQGNGLYLTDYFGTNLPRWAMSHVDPILYVFVPIFIIFPHAMTLVVSQLVLVIFSSILIYLLAKLHLKSKLAGFLLGLAYLFNPSIGYLTAWSGFHGVTAVIPFFLGAIYVFELMFEKNNYSKRDIGFFWILLVLTMMGKEQIPLYIFLYGFFILFFRNVHSTNLVDKVKSIQGKLALSMMLVSILWFITAFFIIIPSNAHYRIEGYSKFTKSLGIEESANRDVALPNYFLNRYEEFGDSYFEVGKNILLNPEKSIRVFFGGDKIENFRRTFEPLGFLPFLFPMFLLLAAPDLMINFLTTAGGIGTSEIMNHRISMILPVLFVSTIFGIGYLSNLMKKDKLKKVLPIALSVIVFVLTIYTTHYYNNPVYLWMNQAFYNKVVSKVFAKTDEYIIRKEANLKVGDVIKLSELEGKDRECALKIVEIIPDKTSVSGPDSMGAHLAKRETYAIFPALYQEVDYVIVDVFAQKILRILDVDMQITNDVVRDLIKHENYELKFGCGNYFVFENIGPHAKEQRLPLQERFEYDEKMQLEFFQGINIVDLSLPSEFVVGQKEEVNIVYHRTDNKDVKNTNLNGYIMFTSFVNSETGEIYQMANLPTFALKSPEEWVKGRYYLEKLDITVPKFVENGSYHVFMGMDNKIRTRSIYLGKVEVKNL
ncbi:DUF2079 domain-containing protein [Patescibacteria group bacterium]